MRAPEPGEVREHLRDVLSRPEFQRSKPWWRRAWEWILDHLPDVGSPGGVGGWGAIAQVVVWIALVALAMGVLVLLWWVVRNWTRSPRRDRDDGESSEVETLRTTAQWRRAAEEHEAAGAWKDAMRCRYNEMVAALIERQLVPPTRGRTTGELRLDVARSLPDAAAAFSEASWLFEQPWYGDLPTGPAENAEFRALAATVAEARPPSDAGGSDDGDGDGEGDAGNAGDDQVGAVASGASS